MRNEFGGNTEMADIIYHICPSADWRAAVDAGFYDRAPSLHSEGFIHFSAPDQVRESAARHCAGLAGLVLLTVDPARLGEALKWELSRGGARFPHLYGPLPVEAVLRMDDLPLAADGTHIFPAGV